MKVLLDILGARALSSLVVRKDLRVHARILQSQEHGSAGEFPDLSAQSVGQSDLNEAVEGGVANEGEVAAVFCVQQRSARH